MSIPRYYTIGAVAPDAESLGGLARRLEDSGVEPGSVVALARRRDERLVRVLLPEAEVRGVRGGLTRRQWLEFASTFFSASTVSFLMGVVHLWTGLVVQAALTLVAVVGLVAFHRRRARVGSTLLALGMPEKLVENWETAFSRGFVLLIATVPEEEAGEAQEAFLADDSLLSPLAVDRRPVL